jgi:hypothetical protein
VISRLLGLPAEGPIGASLCQQISPAVRRRRESVLDRIRRSRMWAGFSQLA